ncbi:GntR family transcriptional regulator [Microbacterium jiangjiandongii]|uniref:GntR family transcriptional regulator n=1 Tax=Microbacterium jiangjiandongii TaxID=3049071 RepID=UPI00214B75DC|nr:GntR family transcriptional regulator [Microbacterium sp. zg.Y843]MCR2815543.1 GntR family transcriptional regulator [Microbacterium sp. zg.Y843]
MDAPIDRGSADQRPLSKAEYVFQRLRRELQEGTIPPGAQVRQTEISSRYGVSATPVREALRRLEADGMVDYAPHRGATVTEMPKRDVRDLYLFRAEVEGLLARLAAERADATTVSALRTAHDELRRLVRHAAGAEALSSANREFHLAVMRAGSPYIADDIMRPLWEKAIPSSASMWDDPDRVERFLREHEAVLAAVEAGRGQEAGDLMAEHVRVALRARTARNRNPASPHSPM